MKLGILSDTHNNVANLRAALEVFEQAGVDVLIHCGDMTRPELAHLMLGFRVLCVFGNNDVASGEIRQILRSHNPENDARLIYTGQINGARIAISHGHLLAETENLLHSGQYDYVFTGHSHRRKDARIGITRHINPGALGGLHPEPRSVCIFDLDSGQAQFHQIAE